MKSQSLRHITFHALASYYIRSDHMALHYDTVQYSTVQYSTVQCSTVQYSTVQYSSVQYINMYAYIQRRLGVSRHKARARADNGCSVILKSSMFRQSVSYYKGTALRQIRH